MAGLLGLMIATQGIRDSGLVQHLASLLIASAHSLRMLGLLLASAAAVLSMALTNDVSLFLLVPLTLAIGQVSNLPVTRTVVLEAMAVNTGSTLSPIGNPQNLLLWQHGHASFLRFAGAMLPVFAVMLLMLLALAWAWLPAGRVSIKANAMEGHTVSRLLATVAALSLVGMVLAIQYDRAAWGALGLLAIFAALERRTLARLDWLLLTTFAALFLGLGHLAALLWVRQGLDRLTLEQPLHLYAAGIVASQLISNVPATVLLLERAHDPMLLAAAANVGGFGIVTGSLANLIALRLAKLPGSLRTLHAVSIPFLLVCASLVYVVMRWLE